MKTFSLSLLIPCLLVAMVSVTGCGGDSGPQSMTEGVELSEIEAYEQSLLDMEAEDASAMDEDASAE